MKYLLFILFKFVEMINLVNLPQTWSIGLRRYYAARRTCRPSYVLPRICIVFVHCSFLFALQSPSLPNGSEPYPPTWSEICAIWKWMS